MKLILFVLKNAVVNRVSILYLVKTNCPSKIYFNCLLLLNPIEQTQTSIALTPISQIIAKKGYSFKIRIFLIKNIRIKDIALY